MTLAQLVAAGRFDPGSKRHRRALEVGELPEGLDTDLQMLVDAYRRSLNRNDRAHLARAFAVRLAEVEL